MAPPPSSGRYRFGVFELQLDERRLLKDDFAVVMRPRAFALLVALVDQAGHLVTKDELLDRVWPKVVVKRQHCMCRFRRCERCWVPTRSRPCRAEATGL